MTPQPPAARSTLDIALWFQSRSESAGEALSQRKLHLLLYLAQAHYAAEHDGQKLMPAVFVAVDAGPVEPNILQLFASGRCSLPGNDPSFGLETFLHEVWARYGRKTGEQIAAVIARDGVWKAVLARGPRLEIPFEALFRGYGSTAKAVPPAERPAKAVPPAERPAEAAGSSEPARKEKEYWTLDGRRAQKWVPGVSRSTSPAPAVPDKKQGGGIRRIIPAPKRES